MERFNEHILSHLTLLLLIASVWLAYGFFVRVLS